MYNLQLTYEELDLIIVAVLVRQATLTSERYAFERQCDKQTQAASFSRTYIAMRKAEFDTKHKEFAELLSKLDESRKI